MKKISEKDLPQLAEQLKAGADAIEVLALIRVLIDDMLDRHEETVVKALEVMDQVPAATAGAKH